MSNFLEFLKERESNLKQWIMDGKILVTIHSITMNKAFYASTFNEASKMLDCLSKINDGSPSWPVVSVWTRRHIKNGVWVIASDKDLSIDMHYQATPGSDMTTPYFKVHDKWKPDSLYRYLVTEIAECNLPAEP